MGEQNFISRGLFLRSLGLLYHSSISKQRRGGLLPGKAFLVALKRRITLSGYFLPFAVGGEQNALAMEPCSGLQESVSRRESGWKGAK